jgi:hypothetical protein
MTAAMIGRGAAVPLLVVLALSMSPKLMPTSAELHGQVVTARCPPSTMDVDTVIHRIERAAAGDLFPSPTPRVTAIQLAISSAFDVEIACPWLRSDVDHRQALIQLMRYAANHPDQTVAGKVMQTASGIAFDRRDDLRWSPVPLLLEFSETAPSSAARMYAFLSLVAEATDSRIRATLLTMLRRPSGPPAWPDMPADVTTLLPLWPGEGARLLMEELYGAPDRILDPLAKWMVECHGQRHGHMLRPPTHPCERPPPRRPLPGRR